MSAGMLHLAGTKGGTGTSTVAVGVAVAAARGGRRTLLVDLTGTGDLAALAGTGSRPDAGLVVPILPTMDVVDYYGDPGFVPGEAYDLVVFDHGTHRVDGAYLVTDASYLALRRLMSEPVHSPGIVLQDEPGRALGRGDVACVTGLPVVACVPRRANIARASDAGVLPSRLPVELDRAAALILQATVAS